MARERRRRGGLGTLLGFVVLIGLLWVGYWYGAHYFAEKAIARVTSAPVNGKKIGCTGATLGGFPLRLDFRCQRGTYAEAGDRITAALGGITASAPLYWPGAVDAKLDAPFVINAPAFGLALTTSWADASANASAGIGGLRGLGASVVSLAVDNSDTAANMPLKSLTADTASASITPADGGSYTIRGSTKALKLTAPDDSVFPTIDADARVTVLDVGGSLGADPARTLLAWLRAGGTANVERVRIAAGGAIVSSGGTLTLSPDGLLSGSILLRFNKIEALADLIETLRPGTREQYSLPLQGLNAVSVPVDTEDGPARQTSLTFTNGLIWLGVIPLPIDPIPPLKF